MQILGIFPIMWHAVRPSKVDDMPAVVNSFRQAQSCGDSWLRFYLLYIWYWLRALPMSRKLKHAGYLLNPFELEAYGRMYDSGYLARCKDGAHEWRRYAKMPLKDRLKLYQKKS